MEACRVLIVEDEYLLAADLGLALQSEGAEIVGPIVDVAEALNQLAHGGFDVAVLDVNLHNQSTYPIADKLIERRIPFVFATGYSKEAIPNRFWEVQRFEKPYDPPTVAKRVVQLGRQRRGSIREL